MNKLFKVLCLCAAVNVIAFADEDDRERERERERYDRHRIDEYYCTPPAIPEASTYGAAIAVAAIAGVVVIRKKYNRNTKTN